MSTKRFAKLTSDVRDAAAGAAWIQWQALGGQAAAARQPSAIVDPEALVLFSLWLTDDEPRMRDFLFGIAQLGSRLLSVQRLKRALEVFPAGTESRLAAFAAWIAEFGKDPRWRGLAASASPARARAGKTVSPTTRLRDPGSLMLRMRTGFGVDVRTDTLSYLIGREGAWADVKEIAHALCYAKYSVRGACESLAEARLIESGTGRPVRYYADHRRWGTLLGLSDTPRWHPWMSVYAFVLRLREWLGTPALQPASPQLASSMAREFMLERGIEVVQQLQLDVPNERDHLAEAYLPAFERTVRALTVWLRKHA